MGALGGGGYGGIESSGAWGEAALMGEKQKQKRRSSFDQ